MLYYASRDKSRLVAEDDPEAGYVVNSDSPGEFAGLLKAKDEADAQAAAEAEAKRATAKADAPKPDQKKG